MKNPGGLSLLIAPLHRRAVMLECVSVFVCACVCVSHSFTQPQMSSPCSPHHGVMRVTPCLHA